MALEPGLRTIMSICVELRASANPGRVLASINNGPEFADAVNAAARAATRVACHNEDCKDQVADAQKLP